MTRNVDTRCRVRVLLLVVLVALAACGDETSPEDQIRTLVATLQDAANDRDLDTLREAVADSYADPRGNTRRDIDRIVVSQMLRGQPYVLLRVQELAITEPDSASVTLLAGLARVPTGGFEEMRRASADIYVFDLELRSADDRWQVTSARWRPAQAEDLSL